MNTCADTRYERNHEHLCRYSLYIWAKSWTPVQILVIYMREIMNTCADTCYIYERNHEHLCRYSLYIWAKSWTPVQILVIYMSEIMNTCADTCYIYERNQWLTLSELALKIKDCMAVKFRSPTQYLGVSDSRTTVSVECWYTIEFVNWGQCDRCNHWTHLKYYSKVRSWEMTVFTAILVKMSVKMLIYYQKQEKNVSAKS